MRGEEMEPLPELAQIVKINIFLTLAISQWPPTI